MKLKCDCCSYEQEFADADAAFADGWDCPPHFTGYVTCDLCPSSYQFLPGGWARHDGIHQRWAREGRPEEFSQATCVLPSDFIPAERLDAVRRALGLMFHES